jgi:hypothetical protein
MKKLLIALLAVTCAACAPVVTKVNIPDIGKSDAVQLTDMRPPSEKEHEIFSLLVTSKEYGIWRVGDVQLAPPPLKLLQYEFAKQPNAGNATPKVVVRHFVVYANMQSQLRRGAVGAGIGGVIGGLIGNAIANHGENALTSNVDEQAFDAMATEEYKRGLFTAAEDPNKASVFIVYIDTEINGVRVFTRTIAPAIAKKGGQPPLADAVELAIRNQLAKYGSHPAMAHS